MAINFGTVRPGSTIEIPFNTFDSNDPSASVAVAALVAGDIEVYKNGSVTQRASDSGYTLLDTDGIDFDGHVGIGGFSIDLSDNTTAGFWAAGSRYFVVLGPVTVDAAVVNFIAATFDIGYEDALLNTTIASITSATQFILTDGPAEADVLIGCPVLLHDVASSVQFAFGVVSDYIVTTKEVFLAATPVGFTPAATDNIAFFMPSNVGAWNGVLLSTTNPLPTAAADAAGGLPISDGGGLDMDGKLANANEITVARMGALTDWIDGGRLDLLLDAIPTTAMRGTDGAALATVATEARLAELDAANLPSDVDALVTNLTSVVNRIGDFAGTGLNTIKGWMQTTLRKDAGVSGANLPSEINEAENTVTGTYAADTDSNEAIRDTAPLGTTMRGTDNVVLAGATKTEMDTAHGLLATEAKQDIIDTNVDTLITDDIPGLIAALNNISTSEVLTQINTGFTTQMVDSIPAVNTLLTREQALYVLSQRQLNFGIVGTTLTIFKVDGTTPLLTLTLNDAAAPTAAIRAT